MHRKNDPSRIALEDALTVIGKATAHTAQQFRFTDQDFERIRKLIYDHAGIALTPIKRDMVYSRLARRLRKLGLSSFTDYLRYLEQGHTDELEAFTNSLTTNLTAFFREEHHFPLLQEHLRSRMNKREITIWCAAASTGEEPYSIAISIAELFGRIPAHVKILASDLDTHVLDQARLGRYPIERLEKMPPALQQKYFLPIAEGHRSPQMQVKPELQSMLVFRKINLLDTYWPMRGPFDAIFCRNVMIYFDQATQHKVLEKFVPLMAPDGLLFTGHSESFHHAKTLFTLRGKTIYEVSPEAQPRACLTGRPVLPPTGAV